MKQLKYYNQTKEILCIFSNFKRNFDFWVQVSKQFDTKKVKKFTKNKELWGHGNKFHAIATKIKSHKMLPCLTGSRSCTC